MHPIIVSGIVASGCALLAACGDAGALPAGSYFLPQAVLGVRLDQEEDGPRARLALSAFVQRHGLDRYRVSDDPTVPPAVRQDPWHARNTEYLPPIDTRGFDLVLVELSSHCWAVQLHDRTGNWTEESVKAYYELERSMQNAVPGSAHAIVQPTADAQAALVEEVCARMGLAPVTPLDPETLSAPSHNRSPDDTR